jgi:hypothetical protein
MLDSFYTHALWLIMDPWATHPWPRDRERWPNIDQHNQITIDAITAYLPRLTHVAVSVGPQYPVHANFIDLPNTQNRLECLRQVMSQRNLNDVIYVGFHWGLCLLNKNDGAINAKKSTCYGLYAYKPLCSLLPDSNDLKLTEKMARYVKLM